MPTTKATVRYALRPMPWEHCCICARSLSCLAYLLTDAALLESAHPAVNSRLRGACSFVLYLACTLFALAAGWALPTTALIRWSPIAQWMSRNEPSLPYVLLACAGLGVAAAWLRPLFNLAEADQAKDGAALRVFPALGPAHHGMCSHFSISGMWAGVVRPGDLVATRSGG